ncbi:type IV pilin [Halorubrum ezzemoulense]|jgi:FlaG/FlaF family flagellin (archaellin)|uniref:Type IV pilin n=1 Tax=Halorubrum ezzemoulense TaxID=337243 RepID=A0A256JJ42_HALEZ|nr:MULTISPECIES: type IV pilin [Halorubrum]MDB2236295.1 type IV pilin [Halorubrum ezzemoulense]MDB2245049.1 type IV pilin [Halorubrum ezzemoulense]MDB2248417.1 type IV pilin [Halorubrum ezzemoulense]MDB2252535.1 type IV pilin [Halorubrum ezzemoulense]MDB2259426.1 type IV pilin [Halorubrum ezzemoulense]
MAPVAGVLLIAITVVLAGGVAAAALDGPSATVPPSAVLSLSATDDRIAIDHRGGDPIDVSAVTIRVSIDGEPLDEQPPLPFFSAAGFHPGPTGPFNAAGDDTLRVGETATFRVADTNDPTLEPGRTVTVDITADGQPVASLEASVEAG